MSFHAVIIQSHDDILVVFIIGKIN